VGDDRQARVGGDLKCVVIEGEVADDRVVERLDAAAVVPHVVRCPPHAELRAPGRQLTDQIGQCAVVRVTAGLSAQAADGGVGDAVPVAIELGGAPVEEDEPGEVHRPGRVEERRGVQGVAELVGGQDVQPAVAQERGDRGHRVEDVLHARAYQLPRGRAPNRSSRVRGPDEVDQVRAFYVVELEGAREGVEHVVGDTGRVSALQSCVVLD